MIEKIGDIELTNEYWDCECQQDFIHPYSEDFCLVCKVEREEQPNSRMVEVLNCGFVIKQFAHIA